jgi:DNA-directed RNA polymerase specialized sigma24 family protein
MSGARSFVDPLKLSEVVAAFGEGCATTDEVARAYYTDSDVKKVVAGVCGQYRLFEATEDVFQEVCVRFVEKILSQMRDPKAVYGVIKATANNICLDMISRKIRARETSLDEIIEVMSDKGDSSHLPELVDNRTLDYETIEQKMNTEKACEEFSSRLNRFYSGESAIVFPKSWLKESTLTDLDTAALLKKRTNKPKTEQPKFSEDTLFLQQLRNILGVTNGRLGELLSQSESVISYYLYTPRMRVPEGLMGEARSLFESLPKQDIQNTNFLAETPVPKIVDAWMAMINIDPSSKSANEDFAAKIGVARSTVWRWRSEKLKPKLSVLSHTHKLILEMQRSTVQ